MKNTVWIVENGKTGEALRYRGWNELGPNWVVDPHEAVQFARREDAFCVFGEDEDAWCVRQLAASSLAHGQQACPECGRPGQYITSNGGGDFIRPSITVVDEFGCSECVRRWHVVDERISAFVAGQGVFSRSTISNNEVSPTAQATNTNPHCEVNRETGD